MRPGEMANRRVALGLTAADVADAVGCEAIELLDWEQGVRRRDVDLPPWKGGYRELDVPHPTNRALDRVDALYSRQLVVELRSQRDAGKTWQTVVLNGFSRNEIRDTWKREGL